MKSTNRNSRKSFEARQLSYLIFCSLLIFFTQCHIEKRHYRHGFYIAATNTKNEIIQKQHEKNLVENSGKQININVIAEESTPSKNTNDSATTNTIGPHDPGSEYTILGNKVNKVIFREKSTHEIIPNRSDTLNKPNSVKKIHPFLIPGIVSNLLCVAAFIFVGPLELMLAVAILLLFAIPSFFFNTVGMMQVENHPEKWKGRYFVIGSFCFSALFLAFVIFIGAIGLLAILLTG
jgi:hypothetical protein